jgi:molybdate transport system ATP-binding protein
MTLDARVGLRIGEFQLDVAINATADETLALLGPNGAGKSTLLRAIAGLTALNHGHVTLDGTVLDDPRLHIFVPPEQRSIGVMFQNYLLFEHLSARENIAFGLRARGTPRASARATADEWLTRLDVADAARKKPAQLSGGQAQRVALARALATRPSVLLLDEPMAALDVGARGAVRRDLRRYLSEFEGVRILVTHDPIDAAALADRLVVIEHGRLTQEGPLADITARPRSRYVADLVGVNLLRGVARGGVITLSDGAEVAVADAGSGDALAVIHPHSVTLHRARPESSARNAWPGRVESIEMLGNRVRVRVSGLVPLTAEVTPTAVADLQLVEGAEVWAAVKATDITAYPENSVVEQ